MSGVEQRTRHDPHRVREVDDPGSVGSELARPLSDPEDHRNRSHRLGESAGPRRLLADASAGRRDRLVAQAGGLAADADLDQDGIGAAQRVVEIPAEAERPGEALAFEDPSREASHNLEAIGIDVLQYELVDADPFALAHQPGDELWACRSNQLR